MFSHDSCHANDVRFGHVNVTHAVCKPQTHDPLDFDPLHFPARHMSPEGRAIHRVKPSVLFAPTVERDYTQRWIDATLAALAMMVNARDLLGV